jgi:hypothetical protein
MNFPKCACNCKPEVRSARSADGPTNPPVLPLGWQRGNKCYNFSTVKLALLKLVWEEKWRTYSQSVILCYLP